jgi:hypothetical protein
VLRRPGDRRSRRWSTATLWTTPLVGAAIAFRGGAIASRSLLAPFSLLRLARIFAQHNARPAARCAAGPAVRQCTRMPAAVLARSFLTLCATDATFAAAA